MSESEELLESLPEENHTAGSGSAERHIVIGRDRYITVPEELKNIAVQFDRDVETVTFDCPALWDEHELSEMTVYVNYIRADGYKDRKPCKNVVLDTDDPTIMHFDWTISKNVTMVQGPIRFLVCIKKTEDDGDEKNAWHSHINEDMYVSEGMECDDKFEDAEKDIITDLLLRMEKAESVLDMTWVNATDETLAELEEKKVNRSGDTITGDLTVRGALTTPNGATTPEKSTVEDGYSSRQTAKGADIVDGTITRVKTIKGKTVKTTNLIPYPYPLETTTNNGITFTVAPDGSITINGTATENATFGLCGNATNLAGLKKGSTYTLGTFGVDGQYQYQLNYYENGAPVYCATSAPEQNKHTFTVGESWDGLYLYLVVLKGVTVNNLICRPMLNEGSEALPYTPYFAGLKHAYIQSIKSTGKNLFSFEFVDTANWARVSNVDKTTGTITLTANESNTSINGYTLTGTKLSVLAPSLKVGETYVFNAVTKNLKTLYFHGANRSIVFGKPFIVTQADLDSEIVMYGKPQTGAWTATISNIMLNQGSTALPFEPYTEDIYELPEAVELAEYDEIDISAGEVIKRTRQITFTGSEVWSLNTQASTLGWGNVYMRAIGQEALYPRVGVCSHYDTGVWDTDFTAGKGDVFAATADVVLFKTDGVQTLEEFKAYLAAQYAAGTPVTIDVRLSSETETEIDIPKYYTAYDKGSETIVQGDVDNSQWGAVPTVVQEYSVMVNPKETATKEFVYKALAEKLDKDALPPVAAEAKNAENVTTSINDVALTEIFEEDGKTVKNATNASAAEKATKDANGNVITDTYSTKTEVEAEVTKLKDGTTVVGKANEAEKATSANAIVSKVGGTTHEVAFVTKEEYEALETAGTVDSDVVYIIKDGGMDDINGVSLTDIFEEDGKTVKNATNASAAEKDGMGEVIHNKYATKAEVGAYTAPVLYKHTAVLSGTMGTPSIEGYGSITSHLCDYEITVTFFKLNSTKVTTADALLKYLSKYDSMGVKVTLDTINGETVDKVYAGTAVFHSIGASSDISNTQVYAVVVPTSTSDDMTSKALYFRLGSSITVTDTVTEV